MKTTIVNGYHVAGNDFVAIAINENDPKDAHYFVEPCTSFGEPLPAYERAIAWTSEGA